MPSPETAEQRFNLITRGLQEVHGGDSIKAILARGNNPKGVWMTAPTGRLHIGYLVPLAKLADFLQAGVEVTICLGDTHAFLVNYKHPLELVAHRSRYYKFVLNAVLETLGIPTTSLRFVEQSSYQTPQYIIDNYKLCALMSQRHARETGEELANTTMLSPLLCPSLQALDEQYLGVDFNFGGVDQRGLFAFAENFLPQIGYKKCAHMMNALLPGLTGSKMSASDPSSKIDCLDSPETVCKKISKVRCEEGENGILALLKILLIPISKLRLERMQSKAGTNPAEGQGTMGDQRPFSSVDAPEDTLFTIGLDAQDKGMLKHYKSYEEIERDFAEKKLHPEALKTAVASAINQLLAHIRKSYEESEEWQTVEKLAYPDPEEELMPTATVPYDVNFCFPARELSNERIKLTPFVPSIHASGYFKLSSPHPELYAHMPLGPFATEKNFVDDFVEGRVRPDSAMVLYAIIDKTRPPTKEDENGALAGIIAYMNTSTANLSTEIGCVTILPPFQKTHVTSNAVGLLLQYALELPENGGLGLRRVQWQASSVNTASMRSAERMGFEKEGVLRWDRVFHRGKANGKVGNGRRVPPGGNEGDFGRDTVVFGLCWDDWEQGGREKVQVTMDRRS